ncbi:MAG TPA: RNA polymerase sigma factor [Burkholderiales bacterium]|jgi:RNA polymerase sigma-70 factor (ECF subfamily)|nr:RNA polymerase sigma factor [Burkholderiales bacterium]
MQKATALQDVREFEALMRRYNRTLFRTARAILRDDAEAEDALQDAYVRIYGALGSFRGESKLSTWLVRIVANEALMRLRKHNRRSNIVPLYEDQEPVVDKLETSEEGPERAAARAQVRRLLESRIDALPDAFRAVFVLRGLEELSVEETAAALEIPEATVRTRYFRARALLREALSREIDLAHEDAFGFAGERCDRIVRTVLSRLAKG